LPDSRKTSGRIETIQCIYDDGLKISAEVEIEPKVKPKPKLKILRKSLASHIKSKKTPIIITPKVTFDSKLIFI
jgi:hypothetical protein